MDETGRKLDYPETWVAPPAGPVLVVAPHPDDETIGCGGVLALHRRQGDPVHVVVVTDGGAGDSEGRYPRDGYVERRRDECRAAATTLDLAPPEFLDFPDQGIARGSAVGRALSSVIDRVAPATIYHPPASEMHPDHHVVGAETVEVAARRPGCRTFAYEVWVAVVPTHVIDVSAVWSVKQAALACYETQLAYNDYRRTTDGLSAYRAIFLPGAAHVEAFAETTVRRTSRWPVLDRLRGRRF